MTDWKKQKIFTNNRSTLKKISRDDSNKEKIEYMTESERAAVDFDTVKTDYANSLNLSEETADSVDGMFEANGSLVFVEFKNGNMKNEKAKVKSKIRDSLLIFCDIIGAEIENTRKMVEFILVYNIDKNPMPNQLKNQQIQESQSRLNIAQYLCQRAGKEFIRFDLERFQTLYFKEVHTYSKEEFEKYLLKLK